MPLFLHFKSLIVTFFATLCSSSLSLGWCQAYGTEIHRILHGLQLNIDTAIYSLTAPRPCHLLMVSNTSKSRKEPFCLLFNNKKSQFNTFLSLSAGSMFLTLGWSPLLCLWLLKLGICLGLSVISTLPGTNFPLSETLLFPLSFLLSPTHISRTNATATFALFPRPMSFCCSELRAVPYNAARIPQAGIGAQSGF